jgi:hypothetical protein
MKTPMLTRTAVLGLALSMTSGLLAACVQQAEPEPERVATFEVALDFSNAPQPDVVTATCPFEGGIDLCPGGPGTLDNPIPFPGEQYAQFRMQIRAVSNKGGDTYPLNGPVTITTGVGQEAVWGQLRQVEMTDGFSEVLLMRVHRTPGPTLIWAVDDLPRRDGSEPSYAMGVSSQVLYFEQPSISDVQRTADECCSPLDGQRVNIDKGEIYVTRLTGNGFNFQDVSAPDWNGMFVFAFNGVEGLRVGTKLLSIGGAVTEFQSATQLTEPVYTPVNGLCGDPRGFAAGAEETEENEQGAARARCPKNAQCLRDDEGVERCTPDGDASLDKLGRKICNPGANECPAGTHCQPIEGQGTFCQVTPLTMPDDVVADMFPTVPYCGPIRTGANLDVESFEGALVKLEGGTANGVRIEGLPVCKKPDGIDNMVDAARSVRSSCFLADEVQDCTLAQAGDVILRDEDGRPCFRNNQACRNDGTPWQQLQSTCNPDVTLQRCELAEPGDFANYLRNDDGTTCRGTLDDFITSGFVNFGQAKVTFEDAAGDTRCATVYLDGLSGFDVFGTQESQSERVGWKSITGTMRQVRFRSESGFWILDVRFPEDLETF